MMSTLNTDSVTVMFPGKLSSLYQKFKDKLADFQNDNDSDGIENDSYQRKETIKEKKLRKKDPFQRKETSQFNFPLDMVRVSLKKSLKNTDIQPSESELRELVTAVVSSLIDHKL